MTAQISEISCQYLATLYTGDAGFTIIKCVNLENGEEFVASGSLAEIKSKGVKYRLLGDWKRNKRGRCFQVETAEVMTLDSEGAVVAFIQSLHCRIGKRASQRIWQKYGAQTWDILCNHTDDLSGIMGISKKKVDLLKVKMESVLLQKKLICYFGSGAIDTHTAQKIARDLGVNAMEILQGNPWMLYRVRELPFALVESLCGNLECDPCDYERLRGVTRHYFFLLGMQGSVCAPIRDAAQHISSLTSANGNKKYSVSVQDVLSFFKTAIQMGDLRTTSGFLYLYNCALDERYLADELYARAYSPSPFPNEVISWLAEYENENAISLAACQRCAILQTFERKLSVITGGPGTGKSTITKAIVQLHQRATPDMQIHLLAPTGKAARRMTECTGVEASTIHSALGLMHAEAGKDVVDDVLLYGLVVIDEFSMVDQHLAAVTLAHIDPRSCVVIIGDPDQLPSVGTGNVLYDIVRSEAIPTTKLDVVYRQGSASSIVTNAKMIRDGNPKLEFTDKFKMMETPNEYLLQSAVNFYLRCVRAYGLDSVLLVCPYGEKSDISVKALNVAIHDLINPPKPGRRTCKCGGTEFRIGDRVMQLKNTDYAKNGEVGVIKDIQYDADLGEYVCQVEFNDDGKLLYYSMDSMRELTLAYACTVHKSQGMECETVIVIASTEHTALLQRNLFYTAITRAKKNVAIIGQQSALVKAIRNNKIVTRKTLLADRLHAKACKALPRQK